MASFVLRRAATRIEVEGAAEAIDAVEEALEEAPGDPALLLFVEPLLEDGYLEMARAILDEYLELHDETDETCRLRALLDQAG